MSWETQFADKVMSAERAVRLIKPGHRILIGSGAAEPSTLVSQMVETGHHLADNEVVHLMTLGPAPYVDPAHQERFRHCAFFIGANVREAVCDGRADFMPVFLSEPNRTVVERPQAGITQARSRCRATVTPCRSSPPSKPRT